MTSYSSPSVPAPTGGMKQPQGSVQEYSIRVPKNTRKKYHVMRFNTNQVDFVKWKAQNIQIKMERENNLKEYRGSEEELPKFGAGSEFGREAREEARRKKFGIVAKKYRPEDQPWILKMGGKNGKKFKGIREGGVNENTAYYVFTQAGNDVIEAYPLQEWYNFQPIQRYKALTAEEAEIEFGRRNKVMNLFSVMVKNRFRNEEDEELEDPDKPKGKKGGSKKKEKGLQISEMDEWVNSEDDLTDSDGEKGSDDDDNESKKKKKGNKKAPSKKKKKDSDDEAVEESDDGDEEGRELDYISDSSESASDHEMKANKELKGVAEEDALRKLLNSESEDEENEEKKEEEASRSDDEESKNKKEKDEKASSEKAKEDSSKKKKLSKESRKKSKTKNGKKTDKNEDDSSSELSPNSTDSDSDNNSKSKSSLNKTKEPTNSAGSSRSVTPTLSPAPGEKRKLTNSELAVAAAKKAKLEGSSTSGGSTSSFLNSSTSSEAGVTEDAVRRYLMRKPMTTTELLQKFKSKKTGLSSEQLVIMMTQILKNINPVAVMTIHGNQVAFQKAFLASVFNHLIPERFSREGRFRWPRQQHEPMNLYATCCEPAASSLAVSQYPPIAPNRNQVVKLLPHPGHLVGRAQIMPSGTPNQILKAKQPQQILPKPIPPNTSPQKQSRLNTAIPQQTPLLINQSQAQSPTLLLNQVLTSGAPVIVQPAGPGGTVHLMLRTPTPTLQSGPGPPQNKMIIANPAQPQPQATVLIQNRQQVVRFMTAQGPMQLQQIQTPSGPQLIAIPQNQSLPFPPNSVLVPSPATGALQLQQNSGNPLQLRQSPSAILHPNSFSQSPLQTPTSLQNHILQANATPPTAGLKRDEKSCVADHANGLPGANEQKKIVIDNKNISKKNVNTINSNINNFNNGNGSNNASNTSNLNNSLSSVCSSNSSKKSNKTGKKVDEESLNKNLNKNFAKVDNVVTPVSVPSSTARKNVTSSLRQVRPGAFANRNKQNVNSEVKEKADEANAKTLRNLAKIIESVVSNTEHLNSPPPSKVDNLTATINSVAEDFKSPIPDDIMSNLSLNDVFLPGNKGLNLDKRPNLTIVQKQKPDPEEPNMAMNRLIMSPTSGSAVDFESIPENYDALELSAITTSAGVQTTESQSFSLDQNESDQGIFQSQDEGKKGKKKACNKKKGKKEENRVDLWDLMKSAGIGDDEFDETTDINTFAQDTATITEPIEITASDSELLAQLQAATQVPGSLRVVVGEDGRPVIINGSNVLIPESITSTGTPHATGESADAEAVLQNMLLPENVFNFSPQAFATAQTQLNQLIQDHGRLATSSSDQQLLSQIFGTTPSSISSSSSSVTTSTSTAAIQSSASSSVSGIQSQSLPSSCGDAMMVNMGPGSNKISQPAVVQSKEAKPEFIGGPPPGLPPLGPDSLVITNNNGVPTLVASPALMQYLQTHQGIIQFQHDPVTKTLQPSLIIPHPQHKLEPTQTSPPDSRTEKMSTPTSTTARVTNNPSKDLMKPRNETKTSVGTAIEEQKYTLNSTFNVEASNQSLPDVVKLNMVKLVKDNPSFLQIASETNKLISCKETNKKLSEKTKLEIDKKIQQNRAFLDQCLITESTRGLLTKAEGLPNIVVKESGNKESVTYQLGSFGIDRTTTETQTLEDLQNLDMTLIKGFHPPPSTNSPTSTSDFQAKFLESIGMANKTSPKNTVSVGTGTSSASLAVTTGGQSTNLKKARKKKEKTQGQATRTDAKTEVPSLIFNVAELTPEQNARLNQALQSRGVTFNQIDNIDAIKQMIHEEVRKITSNSIQSANIRFTNVSNLSPEDQDIGDQTLSTTNTILSNPNLNQLLEQSTGNVISLQGSDLLAINSGNQSIFSSPNQILSSNHFVSSSNQILAIGGSPSQLVSLGSPLNSSSQIVTLASPTQMVSMNGNNIASPGTMIVGNNGNVVAIVHQNAPSGQGSGIVQRIQAIQLTAPKQQHLRTLQTQIQTLSAKPNRTPAEQSALQKLILEQQKVLSSGRIVTAVPGQQIQGMQIVQPSVSSTGKSYPPQSTPPQQQQSQLPQNQSLQNSQPHQQQPSPSFAVASPSISSQPSKFPSQTAVSCGTNTVDMASSYQQNIPKMSVPPTVLISEVPTSNYGPLYVSPNSSNKNVTKCEKGTSPIQIQMGTQTVTNMEYRSGKMSTGTMTSPNTGKPQAVVAPAIVIQQTESQSPTYQMKPRNQTNLTEPVRSQVPALNRTAFIEQQMRTDQAGATMPDTRTPFLSKSDAVKRLIRYHVMDEKALSSQDLATADDIFEATAQHLLDKFRAMKEKYKYLLMLESMREVSTAERIMVDRNFIIEERIELEELREKEKRLKEEFENATTTRPSNNDLSYIKTEFTLDEFKADTNELIDSKSIKIEGAEEQDDNTMISKHRISDINSDLSKDSSFKLTEANRNMDLTRIKSETKECKNTRPSSGGRSRSESPRDEDFSNISGKCKPKTCRTFSDGSSKSSLDSSKDEDSGTDINAQVQSAIDSILNLQKCDTMSESLDEGASAKRTKKKRKFSDKNSEGSKRPKVKGAKREERSNLSEESEEDDEDGIASNADPILDEAIRSILSS